MSGPKPPNRSDRSEQRSPKRPLPGRRALSHTGGKVRRAEGSEEHVELIRRALEVDPERGVRDHVHGFHSYPARLHPRTARALVAGLTREGETVGDPFCGSGTVLIEGRVLGRRTFGVDLNPLAVRLSRFKVQPYPKEIRERVMEEGLRIAADAEERRAASAGPTRRYPPLLRDDFDVHVLLELDGIAHGIKKLEDIPVRRALQLALSSVFSKVSRGVAPGVKAGKRLASGFTIRFFEARVREMLEQLERYEKLLPNGVERPNIVEGDARELASLGLPRAQAIITSPPYPGVLDYSSYHRTRLAWLGLSNTRFDAQEMGSRRQLQRLSAADAAERWEGDFRRALGQMRRLLTPGGCIALVMADSMLCGQPYPADAMTERCVEGAGLRVVAKGAQRRPHFHRDSERSFRGRPRFEHLLLLQTR